MPDSDTSRKRRRNNIELGDDEYVRLWCKELNCTIEELEEAVRSIGNANVLVADYLRSKRQQLG